MDNFEEEELNLYEYLEKPKLNMKKVLLLILIIFLIIFTIILIFFWKSDAITTETSVLPITSFNIAEENIESSNNSVENISTPNEEPIRVELDSEPKVVGDPNFNINNIDITNNIIEGYRDTNEYVYVKSKVHIRAFDNKDSQILTTVDEGVKFLRIGINDNGWSKIVFENSIAYINSQFLTTDEPFELQHNNVELDIRNLREIDASKPMVALTFDDGPSPQATSQILDVLEKYNVVATFFDLGTCMEKYPEITKREETIGCEVESHTYSHQNLNILTKEQVEEDISKAKEVYKNVLGHELQLIRPPYGNANNIVKHVTNCPLINWDIDSLDWESKNVNSILTEIRKYSDYDGRVILMHSIYTSTAEAVDILIPELISKGYQLVTIAEMVKYKNLNLQTGNVYINFK